MLESYSAKLLPLIDWRPTAGGNVEILSDTADYYRYFDATAHAEFLFECVEQAVERDLPEEVRFLTAFDKFSSSVKELIEMPERKIELLRAFLAQGEGRLSLRVRENELAGLTDAEAQRLEELYAEAFGAGLMPWRPSRDVLRDPEP